MTTFDQLEAAVVAIVDHEEVAEKPLALDECLADIDERYWEGSLTSGERRRLLSILLGVEPPVRRVDRPVAITASVV
jgi:hypothetical protein